MIISAGERTVTFATIFGDWWKMKREYYKAREAVPLLFIDIFMARFNRPPAAALYAGSTATLAKSVYDLWYFSLVACSSAYRLLQFTPLPFVRRHACARRDVKPEKRPVAD